MDLAPAFTEIVCSSSLDRNNFYSGNRESQTSFTQKIADGGDLSGNPIEFGAQQCLLIYHFQATWMR